MTGQPFDPEIQSAGKTWNTVAIASAIGGGALAVAGTILLIASSGTEHEEGVKAARLAPLLGRDTWGMGAAFAF